MTGVWHPACVCRCGRLWRDAGAWSCGGCGAGVDARGILRWLSANQREAAEPFLAQYRHVRARDGYRVSHPEYYRNLPDVPAGDPQRVVWQVRRESYRRFQHLLHARFRQGGATVLDLGAGSGWLSARLARMHCRPVAVDLLDDECDGLGASRHFEIAFPRVQADFDDLPFAPRQFDAIVFNGSLHYAPAVAATLTRVAPLLSPGGIVVVMDSPVFDTARDGRLMCARNRARFQRDYGLAAPAQPGEGFLTLTGLAGCARALGREPHFFESRGPFRWAAGRWVTRVRHGLVPPRFGVWMAT